MPILALLVCGTAGCTRGPVGNPGAGTGLFQAAPLWTFVTPDAITATPVGDGLGHVFVRTTATILALDVQTGKEIWRTVSPASASLLLGLSPRLMVAPVTDAAHLIVPEGESRIAAFSTQTGTLLWRAPTLPPGLTHPTATDIKALVISGGVVYVARFNLGITAYRIADGAVLWESGFSSRADPYLAVDDQNLYTGLGRELSAIDKKSGAQLWQIDPGSYTGPMLLANGILYIVGEDDARLIAEDVTDGTQRWAIDLPGEEAYGIECVSMLGDVLAVAGTKLSVVAEDGSHLLWQTGKLGILECPALLAGKVYVRITGTGLFVFELESGKQVGALEVERNTLMQDEPDRSPSAIEGVLVVPIDDHEVVGYELP